MDDLITAYCATRYRVLGAAGGVVAEAQIGRTAASVDAVLHAQGAETGVFITAWNPRSVPQPLAANQRAHARLLRELDRRGFRFLPHVSEGSDPSWTEHGAFVLDLKIKDAISLAVANEQYAIVAVAIGQATELILTELMTGGQAT